MRAIGMDFDAGFAVVGAVGIPANMGPALDHDDAKPSLARGPLGQRRTVKSRPGDDEIRFFQ